MFKEALKRYAQSFCQGLIIDNSPEETGICHGCELGKSHHLPFPPSNKHASQPLELVHSDLVGPLQSNSIQGNKYFATIIDDYTRVAVVVTIRVRTSRPAYSPVMTTVFRRCHLILVMDSRLSQRVVSHVR